jgi:uncharacterized membrane protein YdfJ with MMPL/SSD domain
MGGGLEFASVVALLVVFGLAIDALIHFFNRLRLEERNEPRREICHPQCARVGGPAIILTTLVLAFGLGVTVFSDLPSLRTFGFVCGTTLLASLIADLVFLPALIMLVRKVWAAQGGGLTAGWGPTSHSSLRRILAGFPLPCRPSQWHAPMVRCRTAVVPCHDGRPGLGGMTT